MSNDHRFVIVSLERGTTRFSRFKSKDPKEKSLTMSDIIYYIKYSYDNNYISFSNKLYITLDGLVMGVAFSVFAVNWYMFGVLH